MFDWREWLQKQPLFMVFLGFGLVLFAIGGFILYQKDGGNKNSSVEIIEDTNNINKEFVIEVGGAVEKPGVYRFANDARVNDALVMAGGLSAVADRNWVERYLNRASLLTDGQKIYIPEINKQSEVLSANNSGDYQTVSSPISSYSSSTININTATLSELDRLPGIGQVYGTKIIERFLDPPVRGELDFSGFLITVPGFL